VKDGIPAWLQHHHKIYYEKGGHCIRWNTLMVAALLQDILQERWPLWKADLYVLEVTSPWGHYFWTDGLAYNRVKDSKLYLYDITTAIHVTLIVKIFI